MAFRDFGFPDVQQAFGLSLVEADLFSGIAPIDVPEYFVAELGRIMGILSHILRNG